MNFNSTLNGSDSGTPIPTPLPPSDLGLNGVLPNAGQQAAAGTMTLMTPHLTPHDQRRRAALLADSPELSSRPPLNAG